MEWFERRSALVTGAAHGIGRGTAELLHELGARVVALDSDAGTLAKLHGERLEPLHADLGAPDTAALADHIWQRHGPLDMVVNNVGIDTPHGFRDLRESDFDRVFRTNLRGPWFLTKGLVTRMLEARRRASIVFVSSLHDHIVRTYPHYSSSKAAVAMLVKELARELGPEGIRVNAVSPGVVQTAHVPAPGRAEVARLRRLVPLGRIGQPADVARAIAMLLNDEWSGYVTGANLPVDGGLGLHSWSADP